MRAPFTVHVAWITFLCAFAGTAAAVDGVIEINQAAALAGSVTSTDTQGFPVTIDRSGSYRLTGNLDVSQSPSANAIEISADEVTLDLNGFTVSGATNCTGTPVSSCSPSGADGVQAVGFDHVTVFNGTVRGMGRFGIALGDWGTVRNVQVHDNGDHGISCGTDCQISGNTVTKNGEIGIFVRSGLIDKNNAANNGDSGLGLGEGESINVIGNTITNNGDHGIVFSERAPPNQSARLITANTILGNTGLGISVGFASTVGFGGNVINDNNGSSANPQVSAGMNALAPNVCGLDLTCP